MIKPSKTMKSNEKQFVKDITISIEESKERFDTEIGTMVSDHVFLARQLAAFEADKTLVLSGLSVDPETLMKLRINMQLTIMKRKWETELPFGGACEDLFYTPLLNS